MTAGDRAADDPVKRTGGPDIPDNDMMQNLRGIVIIARSDLISHIKSVRMIVLTVIFALSVLGGAFLFSGLSMNTSEIEPPEFLVWTYIVNADDGNQPNDVLIITTNTAGRPVAGVSISLSYFNGTHIEDLATGDDGRTVFFNFTSLEIWIDGSKGSYEVKNRPILMSDGQIAQLLGNLDLYVQAQALDLDEDNVPDDVAILLLDSEFRPVPDAQVRLPGEGLDGARTNTYGVFTDHNRLKDKYEYELSTPDDSVEAGVNIYSDDSDIENLFDLEGPDEVMVQVAGLFMGLIVPVMAIGISFDSISREKISRSIIFLLCRPISKRAIAMGKFLGSTAAISIPLVLVTLISIGMISSVTDKSPDGTFVVGYIVITIVFMAIFVLLQQIFSTLAKTTGNAILSGISIWLFYFMFFGLIILGVNAAMGNQLFSRDYFILANQMSLLSPSSIYSLLISSISPSGGSSFMGIPDWAPAAAFIVWFVVLFILTIELFNKRPYL